MKNQLYHFLGSGLPNVYLENGFTLSESVYGLGVSIEDLEELDDAIERLISSRQSCNYPRRIIASKRRRWSVWEEDRA